MTSTTYISMPFVMIRIEVYSNLTKKNISEFAWTKSNEIKYNLRHVFECFPLSSIIIFGEKKKT